MNQYDLHKAKQVRLEFKFAETQYHALFSTSYCLPQLPSLYLIGYHCFHPMKGKKT